MVSPEPTNPAEQPSPLIFLALNYNRRLNEVPRDIALIGCAPQGFVVPDSTKLHHYSAMSNYATAVKLILENSFTRAENPRQALLGCILILCLEMLVEDRQRAIKHAQGRITVLQQWLIETHASNTTEEEIIEAFRNIDT
jgi:hypothetical protein